MALFRRNAPFDEFLCRLITVYETWDPPLQQHSREVKTETFCTGSVSEEGQGDRIGQEGDGRGFFEFTRNYLHGLFRRRILLGLVIGLQKPIKKKTTSTFSENEALFHQFRRRKLYTSNFCHIHLIRQN